MANEPQLFNDRNVYILGAGFSADAGLPLLSNFMNCMKDGLPWLEKQGWDAEVTSIRNLLRFRKESASAAYRVQLNVENIEDLFSLAAATDNARLEKDLIRAIAGTLAYAEATAAGTQITVEIPEQTLPAGWTPTAHNRYGVHVYDYYVGILTGHFSGGDPEDNAFITFNYDTVVESAAKRLGLPYSYGFKRSGLGYESDASYSPKVGTGFQLLKVHGSVSWAFPGRRGEKLTPYDSYAAVRSRNRVPVLVPPTWKKGDDKGIADAWAAAVEALEQATRIFIIGCSLPATDAHFRYLIAAGLRNNISLRSICFLNPAAGEEAMRQRVLSIFPAHLESQRILSMESQDLWWLCSKEGRRLLNRTLPEGWVRR